MTGVELIGEVEKIVAANIDFVRRKCYHLSDEQLRWKPNEESWNLLEIFAHLNAYAAYYHPAFRYKIDNTKFRKPTMNFLSTPLGRASWRSMKLGNARNVKRKFRSPSAYNPSLLPDLVKGGDHLLFIEGQNEMLKILEDAREVNIRKARVRISISKIIKFRLGDTFLFVIYHDERHIEQAKNLMNHSKFPKK